MTNVTPKAEAAYAFLASRREGYTQTRYEEEIGLASTSRCSLERVFRPSCVHTLVALTGGCTLIPSQNTRQERIKRF